MIWCIWPVTGFPPRITYPHRLIRLPLGVPDEVVSLPRASLVSRDGMVLGGKIEHERGRWRRLGD
jgi:hypothetical protein